MSRSQGVHPRLIPQPPDPRASLAMLPALKVAGDDFAWAVWYCVWRVHAGSDGAPPARPGDAGMLDRFHAAAESVPELREAMEILSRFATGYEEPRSSADALLRVGEWAAARALSEPAIQCTEAAAALVPKSARRARAAGLMNRLFGEVARAELYYERAIVLARRSSSWRTYVRAHLGKGQVKKTLGQPEAARAHYFTAARAARGLSGEKWLAAQTQHDLLVLAAEEGALEEALGYARQALEWYPRHHAGLPGLAHDVGFLLVRMNKFAEAVPLLQMAVPSLLPQDQVIGWSTLARAAAGAGDTAEFLQATENTLRMVGLFDLHASAAFANLACGAHRLGHWDVAEQYALRSLEISERCIQAEAVGVAQSVLADVRRRSRPRPDEPLDESCSAAVSRLRTEMMSRLTVWRGPTWKRKRQAGREQLGRL